MTSGIEIYAQDEWQKWTRWKSLTMSGSKFLSELEQWLLKRVTIELVAESAGADGQELEGREDGCFFDLLNGCLEARRHRTAKTCRHGKYSPDPIHYPPNSILDRINEPLCYVSSKS